MIINGISSQNTYINFQAKTYQQRLKEELGNMNWWERNFGGGTSDAKERVEHEMLNEIDYNRSRIKHALNSVEKKKSYYKSEIADISRDKKEALHTIIENLITHPLQVLKIAGLGVCVFFQGIVTNISNRFSKELSKKIDKKRDKSHKLSNIANSIETDLKIVKKENDKKIKTKIAELKGQALFEQQKQIDKLINSPMLYLKQNIIIPTMMHKMGKAFSIPNGVLISTPKKEFSKLILKWITKSTNSNYAKLNANDFKTEEDFFEKLISISEQAKSENSKTGNHTFTLITNIEKFVNEKKNFLVPYLKNLMDSTANNYSNTIILSTNNSEKLDPILIAAHRFPVKMVLSNKFLFMKKYGFMSMFLNSLKSDTIGKNLNPKKLFH